MSESPPPAAPSPLLCHHKPNTDKAARFPLGLPVSVFLWLACKYISAGLIWRHLPLAGLLVYSGADAWLFFQIVAPRAQGFGRVWARFRTDAKQVWLTIDDGPDPVTTPSLLDLLDRHQARATFFTIGNFVEQHPHLAAEIGRRGHELANHTQTHPASRLWRLGPQTTGVELDRCQHAIHRASGQMPTRVRTPVGMKNVFLHAQLNSRHLDLIAWSVRGFDCISSPDTAVRLITRKIHPGAIILLHEGNRDPSRVSVIARVLEHLDALGYQTIIPGREKLIG
jgi:peptidoglycan/xylan/chitin deacetylase (PgdA/CDA1 family)